MSYHDHWRRAEERRARGILLAWLLAGAAVWLMLQILP